MLVSGGPGGIPLRRRAAHPSGLAALSRMRGVSRLVQPLPGRPVAWRGGGGSTSAAGARFAPPEPAWGARGARAAPRAAALGFLRDGGRRAATAPALGGVGSQPPVAAGPGPRRARQARPALTAVSLICPSTGNQPRPRHAEADTECRRPATPRQRRPGA